MVQAISNKKETTMRLFSCVVALIASLTFLTIVLTGCSDQSNLTSPINNVKTNEPNWISLPKADGMQVNTEWTTSKKINGAQGGFLTNKVSYSGGISGTVNINSRIDFDQGAYPGTTTITLTLSDLNTSVKFGPSMSFNRTVLFNATYTGLNLTGINPANVNFVYLADDGSIQTASYDSIVVDPLVGKLQVVNAVIPHFSRYGFVNGTE